MILRTISGSAVAREQAYESATTRDWKTRLWADVLTLNKRRATV